MKRVTVDFLCDRCGTPLPKKFRKKDEKYKEYFDIKKYNEVDSYTGKIRFDIAVDIDPDYGPTHHELCPKCRIYYLKLLLDRLEKQEVEENA